MSNLSRYSLSFKRTAATLCASVLTAYGSMAHAADESNWWLRIGPGYIQFDEDVTLKAFGNTIPGAGADMKNNAALIGELGYRFAPNWSVALTLGNPPKTKLTGKGTADGLGTLGKAKYGPAGISLQYQFNEKGAFRPYLGAGLSYLKIFSSEDGAVQDLEIDDTWGPYFQAGAEYWFGEGYGVFLDVKKLYLETDAKGNLGGAPAKTEVTLDPLVFQTGLVFKF
ncbi:TPA: OmpW family protein [Pseudomonas aeruginosa]|nr:OmpW family protein [Pseudomonas aeruginosa]